MSDEALDILDRLGEALDRLYGRENTRAAHYRVFTGGKLDGQTVFAIDRDIADEYYHSYNVGFEETATDEYKFSGRVYLGEKTLDGRKTICYPFAYVGTTVSSCPLAAPKKGVWDS